MLKQIRKNILEMNLDMKLKAEIKCPENVLKYAEMFISFVLSRQNYFRFENISDFIQHFVSGNIFKNSANQNV